MPSTARLLLCVGGIYASFLSWALVQERLSTTPYYAEDQLHEKPKYFRHVIFLNTVQSTLSALAALLYIAFKRPANVSWRETMGMLNTKESPNRRANILVRCFQCALMASIGSPFGYASLRYIDYPTQILGKSCKLVPVMLMNIVLYRRKFALHKYVVVSTVTAGISLFMLCAPDHGSSSSKKGAASNSLFGIGLLLVNLLVDGAINSTQDEVFVRYKVSGTQMMLFMNAFATCITLTTMLIPLPSVPILNPSRADGHSELAHALAFIRTHPKVLRDILLFSAAGATGQLFIFDTLENFGSLTLVTITVTRKLFTMLLSLMVFNHTLAPGQWLGVFTVFAGIGIEAHVKRKESLEKKRLKQLKTLKDGVSTHRVENGNGQSLHPDRGMSTGSDISSGTVTPVRMKDI